MPSAQPNLPSSARPSSQLARWQCSACPRRGLERVSSRPVWGLLVRGSSPVWHTQWPKPSRVFTTFRLCADLSSRPCAKRSSSTCCAALRWTSSSSRTPRETNSGGAAADVGRTSLVPTGFVPRPATAADRATASVPWPAAAFFLRAAGRCCGLSVVQDLEPTTCAGSAKPPVTGERSAEGEASAASTSACAHLFPRAPGVASREGGRCSLATLPSSALTAAAPAAASPSEAKDCSRERCGSPTAPACWRRWLATLLPSTRSSASAAPPVPPVASSFEPSSLMPWLHGTKHG
eukprot:scaffold121248_cov63-Phaeocystis_antarctica.AAC.1